MILPGTQEKWHVRSLVPPQFMGDWFLSQAYITTSNIPSPGPPKSGIIESQGINLESPWAVRSKQKQKCQIYFQRKFNHSSFLANVNRSKEQKGRADARR